MATKYRLGVDVGGTHTDLVLLDVGTGALRSRRWRRTPANPALGVMRGIGNFAARGIDPATIEFFAHGTTITTNALLEMRGAKVGLLITTAFAPSRRSKARRATATCSIISTRSRRRSRRKA